jgi:hypothetical protein
VLSAEETKTLKDLSEKVYNFVAKTGQLWNVNVGLIKYFGNTELSHGYGWYDVNGIRISLFN